MFLEGGGRWEGDLGMDFLKKFTQDAIESL